MILHFDSSPGKPFSIEGLGPNNTLKLIYLFTFGN